ncbi:MAG: type IA DNA topoisomerase [Lachnospiraceae bacterium]|nr:type IA DNA topoisomerase [Lachnospiraceae bacterium]
MGKNLFIAEKPSVAKEFAKALKINTKSFDGYLESENCVVTWCVGHLVTMSYPDAYNEMYKRWSFDTLPFLPTDYKYEIIDSARKQYNIVAGLLNREDVETIYVCTDSGREGEYIYRLVEQMSGVKGKKRLRVWIDSQTEEEIIRGIKEAKDLSEYDSLSDAAYLRAKEDYLMGINFSRALTLKYSNSIKDFLKKDKAVISVGRVMTCVLGIVVNREREIRNFVKTPFYRVVADINKGDLKLNFEWKTCEESKYFQSPKLYKENGFKDKEDALKLIEYLKEGNPDIVLKAVETKKETKNPPLLYNLAEIQNDCSKMFKISPDKTLSIIQELYEKKLVTYPRTDARVLSTAVAKEIYKNIRGLFNYHPCAQFAKEVMDNKAYVGIEKTRYVNDKQITDHFAIIPTGQGFNALGGLNELSQKVYELIVRRFLSVFYPAAKYTKVSLTASVKTECLYSNFKTLTEEGFLKVSKMNFKKEKEEKNSEDTQEINDKGMIDRIKSLKKGDTFDASSYDVKEGETNPPKRYTSGSIILTMENAGQFIEDEELRSNIKGSGIGTSATRAEILKKLVKIEYLSLNAKTQVLTPTLMGEMIFDVVNNSIKPLLDPALTASWEKGLTMVCNKTIKSDEYMTKLNDFVARRTNMVKSLNNQGQMYALYRNISVNYKK